MFFLVGTKRTRELSRFTNISTAIPLERKCINHLGQGTGGVVLVGVGDLHLDVGPEAVGDGLLVVPLHGLLEALSEIDDGLPSELVQLRAVDIVASIVEVAVLDGAQVLVDGVTGLDEVDDQGGDLQDGVLVAASNVVDLTDEALHEDSLEALGNIVGVDEGAGVLAGALDGELLGLGQQHGEAGDQLLGVLVLAVHVVATSDDDGEAEAKQVGLGDELGGSLGCGVGVGGVEHGVLALGVADLTVDLVGGDVDELLDLAVDAGALQQVVGSVHVVASEGHGVAEGVVDVAASGEVENGVDVVGRHDVHDQVGVADVTTDEVVGLLVTDLDAHLVGAVVHLVDVVDVDIGVGNHEVVDEVGADVVRYFYIMRSASSHLNFDLDLAKRQTEENPVFYLQYAHARISSIFRRAVERGLDSNTENADLTLLNEEFTVALINKTLEFPEVIDHCRRALEVHHLPSYLFELATALHKFYTEYKVIDLDKPELSKARLALLEAVQITLRNGLRILGISAPEQM